MKHRSSFSRQGWWVMVLSLLVLLAVSSSFVMGQETSGTVAGRVLDPTGAAVPNAKVELSGGALPGALVGATNIAGEFLFPAVPVGTGYSLKVTAAGFRSSSQTGVVVILGKTVSVDVRLEVGEVSEIVTVEANAELVDSSSSSSAINVDKSFFDLLPKGRSF